MTLSDTEIVLILILALIVLGGLWLWMRRRQSDALKDRFGPEYDRTVERVGDERKAEAVLADREKRVSAYTIKPLAPDMRNHFIESWRLVQAQFVDNPDYAVTRADDLLSEVMRARGYPMADFDHRAEDLSVDHPEVVENYRRGHDIALRHAHGEANTEDLRRAMIHYRTLFDDLVHEPELDAAREDLRRDGP